MFTAPDSKFAMQLNLMISQIDHFSLRYLRTKHRNRPLNFKREASAFWKTEIEITLNGWAIVAW